MTITELRKRFVEGSYTPMDAVREAFEVIAKKDGDIHAFLDTYPDALEKAEQAAERYKKEGESAPALLGVPLAIKKRPEDQRSLKTILLRITQLSLIVWKKQELFS
jgi:Asp-tRNA(Asn)/Glu-tRNA(Gln) amidotransferase A subunit family amidase